MTDHPSSRPASCRCVHGGLRARGFAWGLARFDAKMEQTYGALKDALFQGLHGEVLEIGPGTGASFRHYPAGVHVTGVEPNPHMYKYLRKAADAHALHFTLCEGAAEALEVPDASMDAVVSALVLCSVSDIALVLSEIHRVLKPGGRLLFIEHVAAPEGALLRRVQNLVAPAWSWFGDGCRPNRDTGVHLAQAGFSQLELREERLPSFAIVAPHVVGWAVK